LSGGDLDSGVRDPAPLGNLDLRADAGQIARVAVTCVLTVAAILVAYYVIPLDDLGRDGAVVRIVGGLALIVVVLGFQLRGIITADHPVGRTAQGFALVIPLVLVIFAGAYLSLAEYDADAFSEELDHTGALYFAVTTATTVGYGDITADTDRARVLVMVQMLSNVFLLGVAVRLMLQGIKVNQSRREQR
jgi:hypothetical protein